MPEWLGIGAVVAVVVGLLWLTMRVLRRAQEGDLTKPGTACGAKGYWFVRLVLQRGLA